MKNLQLHIRLLGAAILLIVSMTVCNKEDGEMLEGSRLVYEENFNGNSGWVNLEDDGYVVYEKEGKYVQRINKMTRYADRKKQILYLYETTMVGTNKTFIEATNANIDKFRKNLPKYNDDNYFDMYFTIDVDNIRKVIKLIGR